jgi:predicted 3-demethylubiquinone-9 3-methyltransferase (glyoxalase superfamily)
MNTKNIYPCLWFDHNALEVVEYYQTIFDEVRVLYNTSMVLTFEINGTKFMGLNGGPQFKFTSAVSYFVYCGGSKEKIDSLYEALSDGGKIVFPLEKYDWSPRYAWVEDMYGVNWQLDIEPINSEQKIVPCLLFGNAIISKVGEAMLHYTGIFRDSMVLMQWPFPKEMNQPDGALLFAQFKLNNFIMNAMSSPNPLSYGFSEASSFVVECDTQEDIDHYWNRLLEGGGKESMCGWLQDKYGLWWQIVPSELPDLMSNPNTMNQVSQVVLRSKKFNLKELREAAI